MPLPAVFHKCPSIILGYIHGQLKTTIKVTSRTVVQYIKFIIITGWITNHVCINATRLHICHTACQRNRKKSWNDYIALSFLLCHTIPNQQRRRVEVKVTKSPFERLLRVEIADLQSRVKSGFGFIDKSGYGLDFLYKKFEMFQLVWHYLNLSCLI